MFRCVHFKVCLYCTLLSSPFCVFIRDTRLLYCLLIKYIYLLSCLYTRRSSCLFCSHSTLHVQFTVFIFVHFSLCLSDTLDVPCTPLITTIFLSTSHPSISDYTISVIILFLSTITSAHTIISINYPGWHTISLSNR